MPNRYVNAEVIANRENSIDSDLVYLHRDGIVEVELERL